MPEVFSDEEIGLTPLSDEDIGLVQFKDTTPNEPFVPATPSQPPAPEQLTTYGGPPKQLASAAETLLEPKEAMLQPRVTLPKFQLKESDPAYLTAGKEAANVLTGVPEFMSSNVGILGAVTGAVAPVATAGAFTLDMLHSLGQQVKSTYKNWDNMTPTQKTAAIVDMVATGGFAALLGKTTVKGLRSKPTAPAPLPDIPGVNLETPQGAPAPRPEPIAPIERATPEQAAAQSEQMAARFEEKPATEPSILAPEKPEVAPTAVPMSQFMELKGPTKLGKKSIPAGTIVKILGDVEGVGVTVEFPGGKTGVVSKDWLRSVEEVQPKEVAPVEKPVEEPAKPAVEAKAVEPLSDERIGLTAGISPTDKGISKSEKAFRATAEGQKAMASRGSRIAVLQQLNEAIRKVDPREAYDRGLINSLPDSQIDGMLESLRQDYNRLIAPKPAEAPVEAVAKVETKVQDVAQTEGVRPAKEIKSELLDRLQKAIEEAPTKEEVAQYEKPQRRRYKETITIEIPDDGTFVVPNTKENISEVLARAKRISTSTNVANAPRIYRASQDIARQAEAASQAYGSVENAYRSVKRQKDSLQAQETPRTEEERNQWNKQIDDAEYLMRELYGNTKAGKLEQQAETARDRAATYRMGAEGFEKEIKRIESLKKQTASHKERLDDLRTRYAQNQQFIADYERDAAKWEQEAAKEKAKLESPEMIGMGNALMGEVDTGAGADIYGIAQRVREERARAGQVVDVPPGEGISAPDSIAHGRELLNAGKDPEMALKNFEATKRFSADDLALVRAHGEQLALAARRIEEKFGTTSQEYLIANKALSDWDTRVKPMQTEWHKAGQAQQGYTDIDTGSFTGLERAYRQITGKDFDSAQKKKATKLAKEVTDADKAVEAAKPVLQTEIDRIGTKVEPHIRRLADKIIAAMDTAANSALERIKARQAEGRAFSVADPRDLEDVVIYGAAKITKGVVEFGVWSTEMLKEVGEGIKPYLKEIHDRAIVYEDQKTTELAGGGVTAEKVKASKRASKVPTNVVDQRKAFQDYKGGPMSNDQLRVLWNRAKTEYIDKGNDSMADTVTKLATDLGLPVKDVLKGLAQTRIVKRVADDVWQKQRQARILKQSAKRWLNTAEETWLQKAVPTAARVMFSLKTGLHGTVAIGTHAPLEVFLHPKIIAENFGKMYKLVFSPEYYDMQVYDLQRRPNYNTANRAKLVNDPTKMEDFNDPKLAQGFPKLAAFFKEKLGPLGRFQGAGVRGYAVLKILRQDLFDNEWNKLPESVKTPELAKMIATSINHMTGVTETKLPDTANYALFAPKLLYSRIQVMVGDPIRAANSLLKGKNMTPEQRWFAMNQVKEKATIFGVATSLLVANQALNNFLGDKKKLNGVPTWLGGGGWNPMESDFMKFRIAGMNVAWGSPFLTMSRLPARLIQIGMGSGGKSKFLVYPDESMYKTIGSYLRTQSSPFIAPIISLVTKADYEDRPLPQIPGYGPPPPVPKRLARKGVKPYTWPEFVTQTVLPIPFQEGAKEVWHYGMANTPQEREALLKALVIVFIMAGTGARIQEDWETGGSPTVNSNKF